MAEIHERHVLVELSDGSGEWMIVPRVAPHKGRVHRSPECSANLVYDTKSTVIRTEPLQTTYEYNPNGPGPAMRVWAVGPSDHCVNMVYDTGGTKIVKQASHPEEE